MRTLSILPLLPSLSLSFSIPFTFASSSSSSSTSSCKTYPNTPSWPSQSQWSSLNDTLQGRLIKPVPPGGVCHPEQPNYDEATCREIAGESEGGEGPGLWRSYDWHAEDPVSMQYDNWANWTCLPDVDAPCSGQGYPAYVVNASTVEHVQAGVNFARENNIRLVVRSTGHDFLGRSVAPGSLSIWVHHLNSLTFHEGHFKLSSQSGNSSNDSDCHAIIPGDAITAGGGAQMYDLYSLADEHDTVVVGGGAKSVSVGGYVTGGGHSILSPTLGLAVDSVLEMEVVTPGGEILVANERQNADLFWALRGGGGSTFGVVTSITLKAHPTLTMQYTFFFIGVPNNSTRTRDFLAWILGQIPTMMDAGIAGYDYISATNAIPYPYPGVPSNVAGLSGSLGVVNKEEGALAAELQRLQSAARDEFGAEVIFGAEDVKSYGSFLEFFDVHFDQGLAGNSGLLKGRLLDETVLTSDPEAIVDAIITAQAPSAGMSFYPLGGKGVNEAVPRGGSNSVNPGWRTALVHSFIASPVVQFNMTSQLETAAMQNAAFEPLAELTLNLGAYLNEASAYEENPGLTFWGDNYERLVAIKRAVDPEDVFWCSPCVGNENWEQREDGQLCKV